MMPCLLSSCMNRYGHRWIVPYQHQSIYAFPTIKHQTQVIHHQHHTRNIITTSASPTLHQHIHRAILHDIHPHHLYNIINNVDQYYQFLPYCQESRILQTSKCGTMYDAVLRVGLPGLSHTVPLSTSSLLEERYVSRVKMIPPVATDDDSVEPIIWTVEAKSIQSQLFDSLKSRWQVSFADNKMHNEHRINSQDGNQNENTTSTSPYHNTTTTTPSSCNVNFEVEIQVSNPLISFTLDRVLKDVAKKQVDAFEQRCVDIPYVRS